MDWLDTPEQAAFRERVRTFVRDHLPPLYRQPKTGTGNFQPGNWQSDRVSEDPEVRAASDQWASALAQEGWVAPSWPREYGGAGLTMMEQFILNQEIAEAEAPFVGGMGVKQIGPAVIIHGTDEQKATHLPPILAGEVAWAQGYSEPGAGSDLASLQTKADRDGDVYVLNGQKIWTSGAHMAEWLVVLARTDPEAPKHRGISFLLVDRETPGVTVRPIIDMGFEHNFNEVFFEDARVPVSNRIGEENRGWYVAMTLLDFERSRINVVVGTRRQVDELIEFYRSEEARHRSRIGESTGLRHALAQHRIEMEVSTNFAMRVISMQARGQVPAYEASVGKTFVSELQQRLMATAVSSLGLYGQVWDPDSEYAPMRARPIQEYVRAIPTTIGGGANEIQRNVIATRGLGLPRG